MQSPQAFPPSNQRMSRSKRDALCCADCTNSPNRDKASLLKPHWLRGHTRHGLGDYSLLVMKCICYLFRFAAPNSQLKEWQSECGVVDTRFHRRKSDVAIGEVSGTCLNYIFHLPTRGRFTITLKADWLP